MIQNFFFSRVVGKPFAITVFMILRIIRMRVLSEKRMELSQTISSLIGSIRTEKGCNRCDFCQSIEDESKLLLLEEWDAQENLKNHLKSGRFKVLPGAMNLLIWGWKCLICGEIVDPIILENRQSYQNISPHPSLPKRGIIPLFGKGRLGGIL